MLLMVTTPGEIVKEVLLFERWDWRRVTCCQEGVPVGGSGASDQRAQ